MAQQLQEYWGHVRGKYSSAADAGGEEPLLFGGRPFGALSLTATLGQQGMDAQVGDGWELTIPLLWLWPRTRADT